MNIEYKPTCKTQPKSFIDYFKNCHSFFFLLFFSWNPITIFFRFNRLSFFRFSVCFRFRLVLSVIVIILDGKINFCKDKLKILLLNCYYINHINCVSRNHLQFFTIQQMAVKFWILAWAGLARGKGKTLLKLIYCEKVLFSSSAYLPEQFY